MKKHTQNIKSLALLILLPLSILNAGPLQLTDSPLFLNRAAPPALAVTFDDSGSMAWAFMPDSRQFDPSLVSYASSDYNQIYYNPSIVYTPPLKADGTSLPNANFKDAKPDGFYVSGNLVPKVDLSDKYQPFYVYAPDFANNSYSLSFANAGQSNSENPAFYYTWDGSPNSATINGSYTKHNINTAFEKKNFANWYSYYNTRAKLSKAAVSQAFAGFGPDFKIDWQQLNANMFNNNPNMKIFDGSHRNDFYDWLYGIPSVGGTPLKNATIGAGEIFKLPSVYLDASGKELSCQQNFHIAISDGSWNGSSTGFGDVDGHSLTLPQLADGSTQVFDPSKFPGKMYKSSDSDTLADIAFDYWSHDLRDTLDNNVPVFIEDYTDYKGDTISLNNNQDWWSDNELFWNPKNDPASWQHMVNFNIGLGVVGSLNQATDLPNLRDGNATWPSVYDVCYDSDGVEIQCFNQLCRSVSTLAFTAQNCLLPDNQIDFCFQLNGAGTQYVQINCNNRIKNRLFGDVNKVDDVWHASVNSRGKYFSAKDPTELAQALFKIVSNIIKRKGRASAGSISSSIISDSTLTFRTGYDTGDWSGFVTAAPLNSDGTLGDVAWDAGCKLTGGVCASMSQTVAATNNSSSRTIFSYDKVNSLTYDFKTNDIPTSVVAQILNSSFAQNNASLTIGDFVDYIRGDRTQELQSGGTLRDRRSLLGDVIHSPAEIIRGPSAPYVDKYWSVGSPEKIASDSGAGYKEYREANKDRKSVVLVGANDGMLHAFDAGLGSYQATGGDELWAYMPSAVMEGLSEFTNPQYGHKSYVDAEPYIKDAFINNAWNTVAIGGMRLGGKLFYALNLGENPSQTPSVLWEFTDQDDSDMGYSYSKGLITRVANKNNLATTRWIALVPNGYNSTNHQSVLFAIDLETGTLLHKWNYHIGSLANPNGMGSVVAGDFAAYNSSTVVYAADQASDFAYAGDLAGNLYRFDLQEIFSGSVGAETTPDILYSGSSKRPITTSPRIFTPDDGTENVIVVFGTGKYIEKPDRGLNIDPQYMFGLKDSYNIAPTYSLNDSRIVEQDIVVNPSTPNIRKFTSKPVATNESWKFELPKGGERLVNAIGRNNNAKLLTLATIIPSGIDACLGGGESWLMILDARTGGTPSGGRFFLDGDSDSFLVNDLVLDVKILTVPGGHNTFISIDVADTTNSGNGGNSDPALNVNLGRTSLWGRRSWHRIIFD